MDSLKTIFFIGILAAIAYGVYVSINNDRRVTLSPEATDGWPSGTPNAPDVQLGAQSEAPPFSFSAPGEGTMPGPPPVMSIASTEASAPTGNTAPPFGGTSGASMADKSELPPPIVQAGSIRNPKHGTAAPDVSASARLSPRIGRPGQIQERPPFAEFIAAARERLDRGEFVETYEALSAWNKEQRLTNDEARQLAELLDQVAGTVVYSTEHILEPAYRVRPGDTLDGIAKAYNVTPRLLAKINGISDPQSLAPGEELKVVRGPFNATVDLDKLELTLDLQGRYAGRFSIGTGNDYPQPEGSYTVREKTISPTYYGRQGTVGADEPDNPLGKHWIGLDDRIGIHGTNDPRNVGAVEKRGTICLGDRDIDDVFDILTVGSRVVIRR